MEHTTLSVQIAGRDYTLTSADSPEHTQRVASLVDRPDTGGRADKIAGR